MKKIYQYIALAALTLSFAACEKDNDFQGVSDPDAVKINATIGALQTRVAYIGEDGIPSFEANDQIRVINHTRAGKNKSDAIYKTDGINNWSPVDDDNYLVWQGVDANTFYGIYPATASYTAFTLPTDQSDVAKLAAADWMTDDYEEPKSDGFVTLEFQHRLTKVTVKITQWNFEYTDAEKVVSEPSIYSKGLKLEATYGDNVEITTSDNGGAISAATTATHEYTAIVMPAAYASTDHIFTFNVDGTFLTVLAGNNSTLTGGLKAGKHYTFSLIVGKEAVSIPSVSVADWNKEEIDGGVAEECKHSYGEDGTCTNCGAAKPEETPAEP